MHVSSPFFEKLNTYGFSSWMKINASLLCTLILKRNAPWKVALLFTCHDHNSKMINYYPTGVTLPWPWVTGEANAWCISFETECGQIHMIRFGFLECSKVAIKVQTSQTTFTLAQKRNSSPFHLQILKWPDGVNYTDQKKELTTLTKKSYSPIFKNSSWTSEEFLFWGSVFLQLSSRIFFSWAWLFWHLMIASCTCRHYS